MTERWEDPRYAQALYLYERTSGTPIVMGTCTNCGGSGRVI